MHSFQSIASSKNTSLAVVAPGIAEALLATAIGLFAAIPATIFYNYLSSETDSINNKIDDFIAAIDNDDYSYLSNEIDIDNFIDYMIFQSYIGNRDWPKNNVRFFAINDGPFRFVLFDLDLVATQEIDSSPMSFINNPIENPITDLFNIMYSNEDFRQMYDARFEYLINSKLLSSARFNEIVTEYKNNIEHIMPAHINKYSTPETFTEWYLNIDHLKNNFEARENYIQ
jgi:hypothetical protein